MGVRSLGYTSPRTNQVDQNCPPPTSNRTALAEDLAACSGCNVRKVSVSESASAPVSRSSTDLKLDLCQWSSKPTFVIPYSSKAIPPPPIASQKYLRLDAAKRDPFTDSRGGVIAPFARYTASPQLRTCQSSPVLPPLK